MLTGAPVVERSILIKARPSTVWEFLSTQEGLRMWWDESVAIAMRVGGSHRHVSPEAQVVISGTVLEIVPEQRLVLSWFEEGGDWLHPTRLTFTLTETPEGTLVTQRYDGFAGIGKPTWERTMQAYDSGIDRHDLLSKLRAAVLASHAA